MLTYDWVWASWEIEYLPNGYDLNTVYFYNDTIGYAVGDNGAMIKTIDAGDNWTTFNTGITKDITDVKFINQDTGYICTEGEYASGGNLSAQILVTYDGGATWSSIFSDLYYSFYKISRLDLGEIILTGSFYSTNTYYYYGNVMSFDLNTGQTNTLFQSTQCVYYDSYYYSPSSVTLCGGFSLTSGGSTSPSTYLLTNISGVNIPVNFPTSWGQSNELFSMDMLDSNPVNGVAVGEQGKIYNLVNMTSSSNIVTQNTSFSSSIIDLWSVEMMNDKGWIVGDLGTILFTVDSGQTWSTYNNPILFEDLHSVVFTDPCKGYFVGENGVVGRYRYEENVSVSLCENSQNLSLFSLLDSNAINLGGVWTDSSGNSISPNIDPSTLALGMHSFYYSFYLCNEVKESVVNISIYEVPDLSTTVLNNVLCSGDNTGSAQVNMLNGSIIYANCLWSNGSNNAVASNLLAGSYTVSVTDTNGCSASTSVTITQPSIITPIITITNVSCNGYNDGSIVATATWRSLSFINIRWEEDYHKLMERFQI